MTQEVPPPQGVRRGRPGPALAAGPAHGRAPLAIGLGIAAGALSALGLGLRALAVGDYMSVVVAGGSLGLVAYGAVGLRALMQRGAPAGSSSQSAPASVLTVSEVRDLEPARAEPQASTREQDEEAQHHARRLEVVGRLAGGIAHDFNNTLTVILSYGELLKARLGPGHALTELADHIVHAAEHGAVLTKQLLTFTRRQVTKPSAVDVRELLGSTERALSRIIPRAIRVHRGPDAGHEQLFVRIDALQLQQAILNLVLNARDAMPNGGDLFLEARGEEVKPGSSLPVLPGHYVVVRVRDTGTGIPSDVLGRMFEPFFTTKEPGRGTGLGLSNVREITEAAGGHVAVKSELGKGSEFALYFPQVDARPSGVHSKLQRVRDHRALVLVVDDEQQIREVIATMLGEGGYLVKTAETAREALQVLAEEPVDLVCTDLVMPDMTGARLIDELRKHEPGLPVVVCSAYGSDAELSRRVSRGDAWFLAKPFTRSDLLDVVGRALTASKKREHSQPGRIP